MDLSKYSTKDRILLSSRVVFWLYFLTSYGYGKITNPTVWPQIGGAMWLIGITFRPAFRWFMAAFAESVGAFLLALWVIPRISAGLIAFTMLIATLFHLTKWERNPMSIWLGVIALVFVIVGAGNITVTKVFKKK